jgi:Flp pilus assembly protein TadD
MRPHDIRSWPAVCYSLRIVAREDQSLRSDPAPRGTHLAAPRGSHLGLAVAIACVLGVGYGHVLGAPFAFDDYANIVDNPWIRWGGGAPIDLGKTAFDGPTARPVAYVSFALNHALGGLDPFGFRLFNVVLLGLCGVLVFDIQRRLLRRWLPGRSALERDAIAGVTALLFVAHPLQTQAVTYIVQRMALLSLLGSLVAIAAWLRARETEDRSARLRWGGLALAGWAFGMGSKEIAITLPAALWWIEWCAYRNLDPAFARRSLWILGIPAVIGAALAYAVVFHDRGWGYAGRPFAPDERLLTSFRVVVHYLSLAAWPAPSRLNLLHDFELSQGWLVPPTTLASALCVVAAGVGLGLAVRLRKPLLVFGVGWVFLQLALETFVLPLALSFEHRMLGPLVGLAMLAAWALFEWLRPRTALALGLSLVLVVALTLATRARNEVWSDEVRLWADVVAKSPGRVEAQNNLGNAALRAGDLPRAREAFERAIALDPLDAEALSNLGVLELDMGRREAAVGWLERALEGDPGHARTHYNLGRAYALGGDVDAALVHVERAVALAPKRSEMWNGVGAVRAQREEWPLAVEAFERAVALAPNDPEPRGNLAVARAQAAAITP